ncbi:phosphatase PAP2 family protein [Actinocorallia longicatena]|uniref:Phosphatidic acid phosphatase type 2/haloperoxidase domain-containing protein n=1 Tax=Actinocorallia longicatena TaxID=111803 RepID=A0ABP6PV71_9ACTN
MPESPSSDARGPLARYRLVPVALPFLLLTPLVLLSGGRPLGPDLHVHEWSVERRASAAVTAAHWLTATGIGPIVVVLTIVAGVALAGPGAAMAARVRSVLFALGVVLFGPMLRRVVAELVERPRPPLSDWAAAPGGWAFPSGHTASATVVAVLLAAAFTRWEIRALIALWAAGVGLTRIYLGVHWSTDVIGGWSFGLLWAGAALRLRQAHLR